LKALSTPERTKIAGKFQRCNAFSIAACTGIPRETVRRKVEVLVAKGLVNRTSDGLAVGPGIAQRLDPNFPKWQVDQILEMAAKLQRLLSNAPAGQRK
jgi:predicted transcriptional regulator